MHCSLNNATTDYLREKHVKSQGGRSPLFNFLPLQRYEDLRNLNLTEERDSRR